MRDIKQSSSLTMNIVGNFKIFDGKFYTLEKESWVLSKRKILWHAFSKL